jgi:hypothetical protein
MALLRPPNKEASGALDRDPTLDVSGRDTGLTPQEFITPGHNVQVSFARPGRRLEGASADPRNDGRSLTARGPGPGKDVVHSRVDLPVRCDPRAAGRDVAASIFAALATRSGRIGSSGAIPSTGRAAGPLFVRIPFARLPHEMMCLPPRPGMSYAGTPRLSPGSLPSGEGSVARIERRAPEGVEVVPEGLSPSSAATVLFRSGALPAFRPLCRRTACLCTSCTVCRVAKAC